MRQSAQWYADNGFRIFPLDGKFPHRKFLQPLDGKQSWKPLVQQRPSPIELDLWFGKHRANIGLATGISGVVVVDCDDVEETNWWVENRPSTDMICLTKNGAHHYYRSIEGVRNQQDVLINGQKHNIDVRGFGGYVVAPPSIHPDGGRYERVGDWDLSIVPEFNPEWFDPKVSTGAPVRERNNPERAEDVASRYISHIQAISGQQGHDETFRAACKLIEFGLNAGHAYEVMQEWNKTNAHPPWSDSELRHKVDDAFQSVKGSR